MNQPRVCDACRYQASVNRPSRRVFRRVFARTIDLLLVAVILKWVGLGNPGEVVAFYALYGLCACFVGNRSLGRVLLGLRVRSRSEPGVVRLLIREILFFLFLPLVAFQIFTGFRLAHDRLSATYVAVEELP